MLSLLIYSHTFFPDVGGMERNTKILAEYLAQNHDVTVFTSTTASEKDQFPYRVVRSSNKIRLFNCILHHQLVIVNGGVSIPCTLFSRLFAKKLINIYQMAAYTSPSKSHTDAVKSSLKRRLQKMADYHIGVSRACLQSHQLNGTHSQEVVYNPVDPEFEKWKKQLSTIDKKYDLLFAGRMIEGKGIFVLAKALELLDQEKMYLKVCITGDGPDKERLMMRLKDLAHIKIEFQGFQQGSDLALMYLKTRILVLPSTTHLEGSPLSIAEAFFFGLPVIVSDQKVMLEVVAEAGLICQQNDPVDLKDKIKLLLSDTKLYDRLRKNAGQRAAIFSSSHYFRQVDKVLTKVSS